MGVMGNSKKRWWIISHKFEKLHLTDKYEYNRTTLS